MFFMHKGVKTSLASSLRADTCFGLGFALYQLGDIFQADSYTIAIIFPPAHCAVRAEVLSALLSARKSGLK